MTVEVFNEAQELLYTEEAASLAEGMARMTALSSMYRVGARIVLRDGREVVSAWDMPSRGCVERAAASQNLYGARPQGNYRLVMHLHGELTYRARSYEHTMHIMRIMLQQWTASQKCDVTIFYGETAVATALLPGYDDPIVSPY